MAKREFPTIDNRKPESFADKVADNKPYTVVEEPEVKPDIKVVKEVLGIVTDCSKLNIRLEPKVKADVLCVVNAGDKLFIDPDKSTDDWYSVTTSVGAEGFCMKKYVSAKC